MKKVIDGARRMLGLLHFNALGYTPSPRAAEVSLMPPHRNDRLWRAFAQCLSGSVALALVTFVCFRLGLNLATTVCLYLTTIVLVSLQRKCGSDRSPRGN